MQGFKTSLKIWQRVKEIIEIHGTINKWELMRKANISRSVYEKESPWWKREFLEFVEYDRKTGNWTWIVEEQPQTEPKIEMTTDWERTV